MNWIVTWFRNLPIKRKIRMVVFSSAILALVASSVMLFGYQVHSLKLGFVRDVEWAAEMVANNSQAALAFKDQEAASQILNSLRTRPQIVSATLRLTGGVALASYGEKQPDVELKRYPTRGIHEFRGNALLYSRVVMVDNQDLATLYIRAEYGRTYAQLIAAYTLILAGVFALSVTLVWFLSARLEEFITRPILKLASTSRMVAEHRDYSVRADHYDDDELGTLTNAFNQMLTEIQRQDEELKESRERFQLAVSGSNDGLWDWNIRENTTYFSPRWKQMLGCKESEIQNDFTELEQRLHPEDRNRVREELNAHLEGRSLAFHSEFRLRHNGGHWIWVLCRGSAQFDANGKARRITGAQTDVTARKRSEEELAALNKKLMDASRQAGMAEVATGVLHNVGNVLNSVNVSAELVSERLQTSKSSNLIKISEMLKSNADHLADFLTSNPKGKMIPDYLATLAQHTEKEREEIRDEVGHLVKNVDHIKQIVAMQQNYARISGVIEPASATELVEDALRISTTAYERHRITILRTFEQVPNLLADRHKTLQILVNLLGNAKQALDKGRVNDKRVVIRVWSDRPASVKISVIDNGVGISPENLSRVFQHGFTTKKEGHGFGLHSGANAAREMGGSLQVYSNGAGTGATFTLELPSVHSHQNSELAA